MFGSSVLAWKLTVPGVRGVPDRLILIKSGRVIFVEMKRPGEEPRKLQLKIIAKLERLGFDVRVVSSKAEVDQLVEHIRKTLNEEE